jgi:hypothetical protein
MDGTDGVFVGSSMRDVSYTVLLLIATIFALSVNASANGDDPPGTLRLVRKDLWTHVGDGLMFNCAIHTTRTGTYLRLFCIRPSKNDRKPDVRRLTRTERDKLEVLPWSVRWRIKDDAGSTVREWLAGFLKNRDGYRHTIVRLPKAELRRSEIEIYLEESVDDGRKATRIVIDMSEFNWDASGFEWQSLDE